MPDDPPRSAPPVDWRRLHALGLPAGSVRALLAVLVFANVWGLLVYQPAREVPEYLGDLLFVIMGHYFAARHRAGRDSEPGPPPLFLPRGTVRLVLVAGSATVAVVLHRRGQLASLDRHPGAMTLVLVGGFLLGVALSAAAGWWRERGHEPPRVVEDVRALVSLAAALLLVALVWSRFLPGEPLADVASALARRVHLGKYGPEHVLAAVVGFYFGSRS